MIDRELKMARITVEDCVDKVDSWFELVMLAAQRSREITSGAPLTLDKDGDKPTVIALREIAAETILTDTLRQSLVRSMQKIVDNEEIDSNGDELENDDEFNFGTTDSDDNRFADTMMQFEDVKISSPKDDFTNVFTEK